MQHQSETAQRTEVDLRERNSPLTASDRTLDWLNHGGVRRFGNVQFYEFRRAWRRRWWFRWLDWVFYGTRRRHVAPERRADLRTKLRNSSSYLRTIQFKPEVAPIHILPSADDIKRRVITPHMVLVKLRNVNVQDWKDEVRSAKCLLAFEEFLKLNSTMLTLNDAWGNDGDKKGRLLYCTGDFALPQRSGRNCFSILEEPKCLLRAS